MTAPNSPLFNSNSFMSLASLDQAAMDAFPEAVYLCAGDGRVLRSTRGLLNCGGAPRPWEIPKSGSAAVSGFIERMAPCCLTIGAPWLSRCRRAGAFATRKS